MTGRGALALTDRTTTLIIDDIEVEAVVLHGGWSRRSELKARIAQARHFWEGKAMPALAVASTIPVTANSELALRGRTVWYWPADRYALPAEINEESGRRNSPPSYTDKDRTFIRVGAIGLVEGRPVVFQAPDLWIWSNALSLARELESMGLARVEEVKTASVLVFTISRTDTNPGSAWPVRPTSCIVDGNGHGRNLTLERGPRDYWERIGVPIRDDGTPEPGAHRFICSAVTREGFSAIQKALAEQRSPLSSPAD